jgi:hypothetical protein
MTLKALAERLSTMSGLEVLRAMTTLEDGPR